MFSGYCHAMRCNRIAYREWRYSDTDHRSLYPLCIWPCLSRDAIPPDRPRARYARALTPPAEVRWPLRPLNLAVDFRIYIVYTTTQQVRLQDAESASSEVGEQSGDPYSQGCGRRGSFARGGCDSDRSLERSRRVAPRGEDSNLSRASGADHSGKPSRGNRLGT